MQAARHFAEALRIFRATVGDLGRSREIGGDVGRYSEGAREAEVILRPRDPLEILSRSSLVIAPRPLGARPGERGAARAAALLRAQHAAPAGHGQARPPPLRRQHDQEHAAAAGLT